MFSGILATAHLVVVHLLSAAFGFEADAVMPATTAAQPPHILLAVIDDLGWAEVGYHRAESTPEVQTPTIDKLVAEGVELNRHYVHMTCTPSRRKCSH